MNAFQGYKEMLRDIVHEKGDPAHFDAALFELNPQQLAIAIVNFEDAFHDAAASVREEIARRLSLGHPVGELLIQALTQAFRDQLTPASAARP